MTFRSEKRTMRAFFIFNEFDHSVVLFPTIRIARLTCENPECDATHGWGIALWFLCWEAGVGVTL